MKGKKTSNALRLPYICHWLWNTSNRGNWNTGINCNNVEHAELNEKVKLDKKAIKLPADW